MADEYIIYINECIKNNKENYKILRLIIDDLNIIISNTNIKYKRIDTIYINHIEFKYCNDIKQILKNKKIEVETIIKKLFNL